MKESQPPVPRRLPAAAAVLAILAASAVYGYFLHRNHLFPWDQLKRADRALRPRRTWAQPAKHSGAGHTPHTIDAVQRLASLPYLRGYRPAAEGPSIRVYDRARSERGLNFFTSSHAPVAILMDMGGAVVKTWTADAAKAFPGYVLSLEHREHQKFLRDAELLPDGGIVAMFDEIGLLRLDADSRVLWTWRGQVHHDLFVGEKGDIWTLCREKRTVQELKPNKPLLDDFALELSPEGKVVKRVSLIEAFQRSSYASLLSYTPRHRSDVFHTNSIVVLDGSLAGLSPIFRRGNLLVSIRNLNTVAVIDPEAGRVIWALSGQWHAQHSAQLLATGHLLLFDNLGTLSAASRVLELDPFTQKILWRYGAHPGEDLQSETVGWVERLPGGNTLITETKYGRALEVTSDKRVVWEFVNPNRVGERNELIAIVYFMKRIGQDLPFLTHRVAGSASAPPAALLR